MALDFTSSFSEYLNEKKYINNELLNKSSDMPPQATTIVAIVYKDGVLMAGDRRATIGNLVAQKDIEKVFPADNESIIGIAGSAGIALELVKLFQIELEHYEKIEGTHLSVVGKANRLSVLLRGNLGLAFQGLAAIPLFAAYDKDQNKGRVFSYDVTGGRYEEHDYYAVGSGSIFAKSSMKKMYSDKLDEKMAIRISLESLYDAAEEDSATAGIDLTREIYPIVSVVDAQGFRRITDNELNNIATKIFGERKNRPDGPIARMT
ncbi:MAG: proteasome subunit beta [Actinomycetota bacterium]